MVRAIIPAAGFGTRMNMPLDKSKELLTSSSGEPLIKYSLDLCKQYNLDPLIVTRKEKKDLIKYCKDNNIEYQIIKPNGEWPNTILKSKKKWYDHNILILPDTIFEDSEKVIKEIKLGLYLGQNAVFAIHQVNDISKWGYLGNGCIIEKPKLATSGFAWGLIGFHKEYGIKLFKALRKRNEPFCLKNVGYTYLEFFKDLTRGS